MSPELLFPDKFGLKETRPTKASDCYALGMMVYVVLSGQTPFNQHPFFTVVMRVLEGERPERPEGMQGVRFTDIIWGMLELCWKPQPSDRIDAKAVLWGLEGNPPRLESPPSASESTETDVDDQSDATSGGSRYVSPFRPRPIFDHPCPMVGLLITPSDGGPSVHGKRTSERRDGLTMAGAQFQEGIKG